MTSFSAAHTDWRIVRAVRAAVINWGYTEDETSALLGSPRHDPRCEYGPNTYSWICGDENGRSYHPELDEIEELEGNLRAIFEAEDAKGPAPFYGRTR